MKNTSPLLRLMIAVLAALFALATHAPANGFPTIYWLGSNGTAWTAGDNWSSTSNGTTPTSFSANNYIVFSAITSSNSSATDFGGELTISSLTINTADPVSVSGLLTINGTTTAAITTTVGAGNLTISGPLTVTGNAATFEIENQNTTIAAPLTTTTDFIKQGNGTLKLTGPSTINGTATLSAGTLQIGSPAGLGSGGNITFGGGILQYGSGITTDLSSRIKNSASAIAIDTGGNTVTYSSSINATNSGGLTKLGNGTLSLNGNNTYTGNTTISEGTLALTQNGTLGTSTVSISGGILDMGGKSLTNTLGTLTGGEIANGTLTKNGSSFNLQNGTISATLAGTNGVNKTTTGTVTLSGSNTYSGNTTINEGALVVASTGQISHSTSSFSVAGENSTATVTLDGGKISNAGGYIGFGNGSTGTVNINSGNWTNSDNLRVGYYGNGTLNLTGGNVSNVDGIIGRYSGSNGVANVSGGTWSSSGSMTIGSQATGTLNLTGGNVVVGSGAGNMTIAWVNGSTGTLNLGNGSTAGTLQAARVTGGNGTAVVNFNHTGNFSFAPILDGSLSVNKLGDGTLTLSGNNSYAGGTFIESGTLTGSSLGLKGNITNNATLLLGSGTYALNTTGAGNLLVSNSATLLGNATMANGTTIQSGTLTIGGRDSTQTFILGSIAGDITNEGALRFDMNTGNRTYSGVISGNGSLVSTSSGYGSSDGILTLTGNNTFTGGTTFSQGTLDISGGSLASTGNVTISSVGTFNIGASNQTIGGFLINGLQSAAAVGSGILTASSYDLQQGTVSLSLNGTAGLAKNSIGSGSDSYQNGVVHLSGNNTATGNITISSGILSFNTVQSLYSGNNASWTKEKISVSANSTLALGTGDGSATSGFSDAQIFEIFSNLTQNGTGGLTAGSSIGFNVGSGNFTLNSTITDRPDLGVIGMDKIGGGALVLGSSNTFTGPINIYEGTIRANTDYALSNSTSLVVETKNPSRPSIYDIGNFTQQFVNVKLLSGALNGGTGTINATGNYTMVSGDSRANLAGVAPLLKTGGGIVYLYGNSTYLGHTTINGTYWSGQFNNTPTSSSERLQFQNPVALYTDNASKWNGGNITVNQYGIFSVRADDTGSAGFTENRIATIITNLISANRTSGGLLAGSAFGIDTAGTNMTLSTALTDSTGQVPGGGAIGFVKYGTGTLTLNGTDNSHSLVTSVTGGTLALAPGTTLSASNATLSVLNASLDLGTTSQTVSQVNVSSGSILGNGTLTSTAGGFYFISANISTNLAGNVGASIGYSGTTTLWGNNTHTGNTAVNWGAVLSLANLNAVAASTLVADSGSTTQFDVAGANTYNLGGLGGTANIAFGNNTLSIGANNQSTSYGSSTGSLSGTGSVIKVGNGTLTFAGNNNYSGGTTISGGTLALGSGGTVGSVTGDITNNAALVFNRSDNSTYSGIVSGNGSVTKNGAGLLTLSGISTYTGNTTINTGTLGLDGTLASTAISIASGAGLNTSGGVSANAAVANSGNFTVNAADTIGSLSGSGNTILNAALTTGALGTADEISGTITGNAALTKAGTGTLSLTGSATNSGGLVISNGTVSIGNGGTTGSITGNITNNAALVFNRSNNSTFTAGLSGTGSLEKLGAGVLTLANGTRTVGATTINGGGLVLSASSTLNATSAVANSGAITIGQGSSLVVSGSTPHGLTLAASASDNATLNLGTYGGNDTTATLTTPFIAFGNGTAALNLNLASNYTLSTALTGGNSNSTLNQLGTGTTTLTGNNSFIGATAVNAGNLIVNSNLASTAISIASGAGLETSGGLSANSSVANSGTLTINATETIGSLSGFGNTILNAALTTGGLGDIDEISGTISGNGAIRFDNSITNTNPFTELTANNTYTGSTTVANRILKLSGNGSIASSSALTLGANGSLDIVSVAANSSTVNNLSSLDSTALIELGGNTLINIATDNRTFYGTIGSGNPGGFTKRGNGTLTLAGNNDYYGATSIEAGVLFVSGSLLGTGTYSAPTAVSVSSGATYQLGSNDTVASIAGAGSINLQSYALTLGVNTTTADTTFSGVVSGANGSLTKAGTGTLTLTGNNTYTGGTFVNAGTLAGNTSSLQGSIANNATVNFDQTTDGTYAGVMTGTGAVTKSGAGTLTLSGTNTYSGATAINSGKLLVNGNLTSSTTTVNSGGTLAGIGTLGAVTINSGGTIAPGNSAGTLTVGNSVWSGGGIYNWELDNTSSTAGTGWDLISSTGSLTIGANSTNKFTIAASTSNTSGFDPNVKSYSWKIADFAAGISGFSADALNITTTGFENLPAIYGFGVSKNGTAINLNYGTVATWIGGTGNWTNTANWETGFAAINGVAVDYAGTNGTSTNNSDVTSIGGLTFTNNASGSFTLAGGDLAIGTGGITNNSSYTNIVAMNLVLGADQTFAANTANLVVTGNISGNASLTKAGNQTLTLSGSNAYTGITTISAGTLQIDSANALGSGGNITFGGGTLQFGSGITTDVSSRLKNSVTAIQIDTDNNNITFASDVDATNTGGLTKLGSGNLTLTGNNTYAGDTTVKNGTLALPVGGSISSAGNMTIGSASGENGALTISGGNVSNAVGSIGNDAGSVGEVTVSSGNWTNSGQLYVGNGGTGNLTISGGAVSNGWTEVAAGGGSVGNILVNGGTWNSGSLFLGLSGNGTLNLSGGVINASGFSLGHYALGSGFATVASGTLANSGELNIGLWGTGSLSISGSGNVTNSNSLLGGAVGASGSVAVSGGTWVNTGVLNIGGTGTGNLTISGGSVSNTVGYLGNDASGNGVASVSGGTWSNSGDLVIGNSGTGSLMISGGNVTNTTGYVALGFGSNGTVNVSGGTWANSGALTIGYDGTGSLTINGTGTVTNAIGNIGYGGGGNGTVNISGGTWANSSYLFIGALNGSRGSLTINSGNVTNTDGYVGNQASSNGTVNVSGGTWTNSANLFVGNQGTGRLTINGTGNVTNSDGYIGHISGSNGTVTVSGGTWTNNTNLFIGNEGTGSLTISGTGNVTNSDGYVGNLPGGNGTVSVSGGTWTNSSNLAVGVSGTGSLTINGTGTVIVGNTLSRGSNGTINLASGGTLQIGTGGDTGTLATDLTNDGTLLFDRSSDATHSYQITGAGAVIKNGAGQLVFTNNNTYTGGTSINQGSLYISTDETIIPVYNIGNMTVASGATLVTDRENLVGNLLLNGGTWIENNGFGSSLAGSVELGATSTFQADYEQTVTANITGTGGLVKTGAGTLLLSGSNSYSGTTAINSGTLFVNGSQPSSATTVNSGGKLGGTGTVGNVTINSGGAIAPGTSDSPSILTVGNSVWNGGGTYNWQLGNATGEAGTGWDLISATGISINATSSNKFTINATALGGSDFDPNARIFTWKIAESATQITGFAGDKFNILTNNFAPGIGAYFLSANQTSLNLNYATMAVWNAGTGNWTTSSNWESDFAPINGLNVEYAGPNGSGGTSDNNSGLTDILGLEFTSGADAPYTIVGGNLRIGEGGITNNSNSTQTVAINLNLGADQTFAANTANLVVSGNITGGMSSSLAWFTLTKEGNQTLTLSGSNTYAGSTTVNAGTLAITGNVSGTEDVSIKSATLAVQANGSLLTGTGGSLSVGDASGDNGTLEISGGALASETANIGNSFGSNGTANMSAGTWTTQSTLSVGFGGNGVLNLSGGFVSNDVGFVGDQDGSTGVVNMSNGTWTNNSFLDIGGSGTGTLNLSGGSITAANGSIAKYTGSTGIANITGGSWFNNNSLTIGDMGNGTMNLSGGILSVGTNGTGTVDLAKTASSSGTLNWGNGTSVGSLLAGGITGGSGTAVVNLNFTGNSTIGAVLAGGLSLNQIGTGTSILTANNTHTGGTTVSSGTLQLGNGGTSGSVAGNIVNNAVLAFNRSDDLTFTNTLTGTGSVIKLGTNTLTYNSTSPQGGTFVEAGTLVVSGTTSSVTVNNTGTLAGTGTVGDVTINSGGTIAPGSSPGTITTGNMVWNGGGIYNWQLGKAAGNAGTDWDLISSTGGLTINATSGEKFVINATALADSGFDSSTASYKWQIANFSGNITGFSTNKFAINTSGFDSLPGVHAFSVSANSTALNLNYRTLFVWDAGNGTWSTDTNWLDNALPVNGAPIEFAGLGGTSENNNYLTSISGLTFNANAAESYTLAGGNLSIGASGIVNNSDYAQTLGLNIALGANQTFATNTANLAISGNITGGYSLTKVGNQTLTLSGSNSYTGGTIIDAGKLVVSGTVGGVTNNDALTVQQGGVAGSVTNSAGATGTNNGTVESLANAGTFTNSGNITGSVTTNGTFASNGRIGGTLGVDGGTTTIGAGGQVSGASTVNSGSLDVSGTVAGVSNNASFTVQSGGAAGSVSNLLGASGTNNGTVSLLANAGTFTNSGNIAGSVTTNGTLSSSGSIGGALTIGAGEATISGTVAGPTTISAGLLQGTGTLVAVTLNSGGTIAPGNGNGTATLNVGNSVWNGGGNYNWQVGNATGTAGMGWDYIHSTGSLSLAATADNQFKINLWSLSGTNPDVNGTAQNFDPRTKYNWDIASFESISGFDKSKFSIAANPENGTGGFQGLIRGRFFMSSDGKKLTLNFNPASVWNSGTGIWSTAGQWEASILPSNDDSVEFTGSGGTSTNDGYITTISGLTFMEQSGAYTLNGTALTIGSDGVVNNSNFAQTIALDLNLGANQPFASNTANLLVSGAVNGTAGIIKMGNKTLTLNGNNTYSGGTTVTEGTLAGTTQGLKGSIVNNAVVNFDQSFNGTYTGVLSGTGSLTKTGSGVVLLSGNNTYSGGTTINSGTLKAALSGNLVTLNPNAFGTGGVNINAGGAMLVPSTTPDGSHLSIGGDLTLNNGTIAFYDIGTSPAGQDLRIDVSGNFTNAGSGAVFDFSQVEALGAGNYTLVSYNGTNFATNAITSRAGVGTTLQGSFSFSNNGSSLVYTVLGAQSSGTDIQNNGGPNTPIVSNYTINQTGVVTIGENNMVAALTFNSGGSLNIQQNGVLNVSTGTMNVQNGSSVVGGGNLVAPAGLNKDGTGELDFTNNVVVTGSAAVNEGLLSVNGNFVADNVVVNPSGTLGGSGTIFSNVNVQGNLAPGNSPGTLTVAGNLILTGANSTIIEIASATNYDRIIVSGQATLGGTLNAVAYEGGTITPGARYDFLQAGSITGEFDSLIAPDGLRVRFLNSGTTGTLLFGPGSYVPMATNPNQVSVAKALDTFIAAIDGDQQTASIALDSLTTEQYPYAFDQIMPGFYETLASVSIEKAFSQTQMLNQRIGSVRLGASGFQAMGGITQPLLYDKDGKSAAAAKDASPIVESAMATNWNTWALGNGQFSRTTNLSNLQNSSTEAGGFLVGADYRWSENFVSGLYAGYEYTYSKYGSDSNMRGNGVNFGGYASYATEEGYYADAVIGGGYTCYQTRRSIKFSTIDRTAKADPNSTHFSAALNLGKDFEVGKFTLGPIVGAQYTYAGIGSFTETGAESLDLALGQQNANSLRSTLGGRIAYTWNLSQKIAIIPEVRMFWQHEFLNNARNINASLDGGNGAAFDFKTTDPYRNSVFAGAGVTAQFGKNLSGSVFYNINFGSQTYQSNMVSAGLNFSF